MNTKAEALKCNVDPLGLYGAHLDATGPPFPKPCMDFNTHTFDFLDDIEHIQWSTPASEIPVDERITRRRESSSESACVMNPNGSDESLNDDSMSLDIEPTPQSFGWQSTMPPPDPPSKKRISSNPENYDGLLGRDVSHEIKRRQTMPNIHSLPSPPEEGLETNCGRKRQLQKNRVAASKCRQKKRRETADLEAREKDLAARRDALKSMVDGLRVEVLSLKNEVLSHGLCDCSVIQKYITETARQIV